ncbi:MAG: FAD-dependent oxidoreductase, partial [Stagnimonas sp.]|nr:FAD-dependent oxidoreductase [Stagnimonas sp.]
GYEEAAAQGLLAGLNAALSAREQDAWCPQRHEAYLGVLVDDLITRGTEEPYRMFTSRAEHRLLLREDNADLRLTPIGRELGLVDEARWAHFSNKVTAVGTERARLDALRLKPVQLGQPAFVEVFGPAAASTAVSATDLLRRPEGSTAILTRLGLIDAGLDPVIAEQVEVQVKYAGYIERQQLEIERQARFEDASLPVDFDYAAVSGLSHEVRSKLISHRPDTVGQAGRIAGVTPAAMSLLLVHLKKQGVLRRA